MNPRLLRCAVVLTALTCAVADVHAQAAAAAKPNVLIIWGDDIGWWNISAYNQGMMGYKTPNIDRIAKEGGLFTDWYGVGKFLGTFKEFPPSQKPGSFSIDAALEALQTSTR